MQQYYQWECCPKCGFNKMTTKYRPASKLRAHFGLVAEEYIQLICQRCGYEWKRAPLNTQ